MEMKDSISREKKKSNSSKGFTKENINKLFTFEWKDIFWIIFFLLLFFLAYSYYNEVKMSRELIRKFEEDDCIRRCVFNDAVKKINQNPRHECTCDFETFTCECSGINEFGDALSNISIGELLNG
jgi:hypothetical protein